MARTANPLQRRFTRRMPFAGRDSSDGSSAPMQLHAPSGRELRSQAVHRLLVGIFGLAGMLLMIGLANVIMERAKQSEDATALASPAATDASPGDVATTSTASDPLVDMGVAPELPVNKPSPSAKPDAMILLPGNAGTPNAEPTAPAANVKPSR